MSRTLRRAVRLAVALTLLAALTPATALAAAAEAAPLPRLTSVTPEGEQYGHLGEVGTGKRFVPRGGNYVRLTTLDIPEPYDHHSTFEPGRYTGAEADRELADLQANGYNSVRVFIDHGNSADADTHGKPHGIGRGMSDDSPVYAPYMDNVADFLERATAHGIRVMYSMDLFPQNAYYFGIIGDVDRPAVNMDGRNLNYLHPKYVAAKQAYMRNFAIALKARVGAETLSTVLAYQSDNEAFVVGDKAPYDKKSGTVTPLNGVTYDMSDPTERQQSADASFVEYANRMVDSVHEVDPKALVTMGMFTYGAVHKPGPQGMPVTCVDDCSDQVDYRYPARPRSLSTHSRLSFLDIHIYPADKPGINQPYTLARNLETIEWSQVRGTVVVGEFGADKAHYKSDLNAAAAAMREMQVDTCQRGMSGWLYWTSNPADTPLLQRFFTLHEGTGEVNTQLNPKRRPDPCAH